MKKTILTMAGILMMGVVVNAQTDSTLVSPDEMVQGKESSMPVQEPTPANPERVRVQATDVPQSVRQTLTASQYKGWESAPIYMNKTTNQYSFSLHDNNGMAKTYTFDQSGQPVTAATGSAVNPSQNAQSNPPESNTSTYSSRKSTTNSSSTTGGRKTTTTRKSTAVKKSNSDNSSSTTKGASSTPPPAK